MINEEQVDREVKVRFTAHQITIIQKWADCASVAKAAEELNIQPATLETHLKRLRRKLGVHRTFDVYRYMLLQGLVK